MYPLTKTPYGDLQRPYCDMKKSRKAEICHIRFFIYQNTCLGIAKSLSWAVTKNCVEVGWAVTKYQVGVGWPVTKYQVEVGWAVTKY